MSIEKKRKPIKEIADNTDHQKRTSVWRDARFWYITVLMIVCSVFYYMDVIVDFGGWL
jgi:cyanate permease